MTTCHFVDTIEQVVVLYDSISLAHAHFRALKRASSLGRTLLKEEISSGT